MATTNKTPPKPSNPPDHQCPSESEKPTGWARARRAPEGKTGREKSIGVSNSKTSNGSRFVRACTHLLLQVVLVRRLEMAVVQ